MKSFIEFLSESVNIKEEGNLITSSVNGVELFRASKSKVKLPNKHPIGLESWLIYDVKAKKNLDLPIMDRAKAITAMKRKSINYLK